VINEATCDGLWTACSHHPATLAWARQEIRELELYQALEWLAWWRNRSVSHNFGKWVKELGRIINDNPIAEPEVQPRRAIRWALQAERLPLVSLISALTMGVPGGPELPQNPPRSM